MSFSFPICENRPLLSYFKWFFEGWMDKSIRVLEHSLTDTVSIIISTHPQPAPHSASWVLPVIVTCYSSTQNTFDISPTSCLYEIGLFSISYSEVTIMNNKLFEKKLKFSILCIKFIQKCMALAYYCYGLINVWLTYAVCCFLIGDIT